MTRVVAAALVVSLAICRSASGQLADSPKTSQQVSLFFMRADADACWVGGIGSKGTQDLDRNGSFRLAWQLDYGTLGKKRVSAAGTEPGDESAVSKNSGIYAAGYGRRITARWRWTADAGLEHKRARRAEGGDGIEHSFAPVAMTSVRWVGAHPLLPGDLDSVPEVAWSVQPMMSTAKALLAGEHRRMVFFEPVAVAWVSAWPAAVEGRDGRKALRYRVQLRAEASWLRPFEARFPARAHYDASITYFITAANGLAVRRFDGYFDHNLRDRKRATTLTLVWKFK